MRPDPVAQLRKGMRVALIALSANLLGACAVSPSPEPLGQRLAGLSKQELLYCMGTPSRVSRHHSVELVTYSFGYPPQSTLLKCDAHLRFVDERLSEIRFASEPLGSFDLVSRSCRSALQRCGRTTGR